MCAEQCPTKTSRPGRDRDSVGIPVTIFLGNFSNATTFFSERKGKVLLFLDPRRPNESDGRPPRWRRASSLPMGTRPRVQSVMNRTRAGWFGETTSMVRGGDAVAQTPGRRLPRWFFRFRQQFSLWLCHCASGEGTPPTTPQDRPLVGRVPSTGGAAGSIMRIAAVPAPILDAGLRGRYGAASRTLGI
jgi:hypothetical protein